jgi:anti-sigma B factor antagonist
VTELTVDLRDDGDRSVLALTGELDLDSVGQLRQRAQEQVAAGRCQTLTLDMAGLTFIDSSGLGLLIDLRRLALGAGIGFEMVNVPSGPARVIAIAGLTETFGLTPPEPAS